MKHSQRADKKGLLFYAGLGIWAIFLLYFFARATYLPLPSGSGELALYSSDEKYDLKLFLCSRMKAAKESLFLSSFGISDFHVFDLLDAKKKEGVNVEVVSDPKQEGGGEKKKGISGILHRKVLIIDKEEVYLGSTNMTFSGLQVHRNLVVGLKNRALAQAILQELPYHTDSIDLFLLPKEGKSALESLIQEIDQAQTSIQVAIYTFTHQEIADALVRAHKRGVLVDVYIDEGCSGRVSKKVVTKLRTNDIPLYYFPIKGLFHHKCALIDDHFIFGSANWSKAAFEKNEEIMIICSQLKHKERKRIHAFFNTLKRRRLPLT